MGIRSRERSAEGQGDAMNRLEDVMKRVADVLMMLGLVSIIVAVWITLGIGPAVLVMGFMLCLIAISIKVSK